MPSINSTIPYRMPSGSQEGYFNGATWFLKSSPTPMIQIGSDVVVGSTLQGFADRIRKGTNATTYYSRKGFKCSSGFVSMMTESIARQRGWRSEVFYPNPMPDLTYVSSDVVNEASARLKRKLRESTGQSNQLTNLAELRELPKTIKGAAQSAVGLVNTVLSSKRRGSDLKKFSSDAWLNWSFGISPTLSAIDDTIASIAAYSTERHVVRDYGIHSKEWVSRVRSEFTGSLHSNIITTGSFKHTLSCKITAGHGYNLKTGNNYTLDKHLGFDISSVVPTAWELLPYSWLIDYFTTAGSFLEDTFSADFGQSIYICQNILLRVVGEYKYEARPTIPGCRVTQFNSRPIKFEYFDFSRTPLSSLPRAPLRLKTTDEIANHAVAKLLNLTSLLGSRRTI